MSKNPQSFWDANTLQPNRGHSTLIPNEEQWQKCNFKVSVLESEKILKNKPKILPGCAIEKAALVNPFSHQTQDTQVFKHNLRGLLLFTGNCTSQGQGETGINLLLSKPNLLWLYWKNLTRLCMLTLPKVVLNSSRRPYTEHTGNKRMFRFFAAVYGLVKHKLLCTRLKKQPHWQPT